MDISELNENNDGDGHHQRGFLSNNCNNELEIGAGEAAKLNQLRIPSAVSINVSAVSEPSNSVPNAPRSPPISIGASSCRSRSNTEGSSSTSPSLVQRQNHQRSNSSNRPNSTTTAATQVGLSATQILVDSGCHQSGADGHHLQNILQEEVDQLMDHSIEIDSNKKIREENVHPWTLTFIQPDMEKEVAYCLYMLMLFPPPTLILDHILKIYILVQQYAGRCFQIQCFWRIFHLDFTSCITSYCNAKVSRKLE